MRRSVAPTLPLLAGLLFPLAAAADTSVDGSLLATSCGPAVGAAVRYQGEKGAFIGVDGRATPGDGAIGRATAGLDVFPKSRFDLTFGAFLGGQGGRLDLAGEVDPPVVYVSPAVGFEFGLGLGIGPLRGRYRYIRGGRTAYEDGPTLFAENQWRLGLELPAGVLFYGEVIDAVNERDDDVRRIGAGLGAQITF
jgi:hypothetical protein